MLALAEKVAPLCCNAEATDKVITTSNAVGREITLVDIMLDADFVWLLLDVVMVLVYFVKKL